MAERDDMIAGLYRELLGPRNGPNERLEDTRDPQTEFITGVLAPAQEHREVDPDADVDEVIEEIGDDEDQGAEGVVIAPPSAFSPALDPKELPRSIGLTFVVASNSKKPRIDICVSWARYLPHEESGWIRQPHANILRGVLVTNHARWECGDDVVLHLRVRPQRTNHYRVSLYLVNNRSLGRDEKRATDDFVFQPQIRVNCSQDVQLTAMDSAAYEDNHQPLSHEENQLAMLYRHRAALARGHMCGAMWKEIDPERSYPGLELPGTPPYCWVDRTSVSSQDQKLFSPPDVRTELLPIYSVEAPEWDWPASAGISPVLNPDQLCELWHPDEIRAALEPLVAGYRSWIELQNDQVSDLPTHWQHLALENIASCRQAASRMQEGIEWLIRDEDVRLSFCFANKAIALQSLWSRDGSVVPWRTFQLAFILLNIPALSDIRNPDRDICDLLWFPTGGGKTEAYLGLSAFTIGLRRRRAASRRGGDQAGRGVSVLSRYTLRLLTIQQFRRALGVITACEVLRVFNLDDPATPTGWRPRDCTVQQDFIWGGARYSAGLWVGGGVTPNNLHSFMYPSPGSGQFQYIAGALDILQGVSSHGYNGPDNNLQRAVIGKRITADGEPAQVLSCPVCRSVLAIPEEGLGAGQHMLHFLFTSNGTINPLPSTFNYQDIQVDDSRIIHESNPSTHTLSLIFTIPNGVSLQSRDIDRWWRERIASILGESEGCLLAARASRPGYFLTAFENSHSNEKYNSFEIYCPNPECNLNQVHWAEQVPVEVTATTAPSGRQVLWESSQQGPLPSLHGMKWQTITADFRAGTHPCISGRIPIPAYTVDDQIYHRCPSLVIATVDKFARLAFEPKAAGMFGHVTHYHARWGYYRENCPPDAAGGLPSTPSDHPSGFRRQILHVEVQHFYPPDLIIQDELHLIEGPLGSMVGLYETAIEALCEYRTSRNEVIRPKYIASTATVRQAGDQVQSLFDRRLAQFPPSALDVDDRFFARTRILDVHPLESVRAGRAYVGVAAPGKGAQTPIVRIWSALLQTAKQLYDAGHTQHLDAFWTLVGYFNALRELAGAAALYRQDIRERINEYFGPNARLLSDQALELSSRANSLALPGLLERLGRPWQEDAVLATSMFGTGVDVDRLGLMVVHGQPKTTSAYIQATGRVGRGTGGLVVAFFRASRPRDLDHYEFFTGYHRMLYRAVEPVTVTPFAPRARERALGPLAVALLRQARQIGGHSVAQPWRVQQRIQGGWFSRAAIMANHRRDRDVEAIADIVERRAMCQPEARRPVNRATLNEMISELDRWYSIAHDYLNRLSRQSGFNVTDEFVYSESSTIHEPRRGVVLGDEQHQLNGFPVAFENAPTSLRDVESTTQFKG